MQTTSTMTTGQASMIIRRKPQSEQQWAAVRDALKTLQGAGYSDAQITMEARRELSYPEQLILAEF
jgi:hypothetical protein